MLEELKSKTIEEQIEIISNKESLKQLMKSVDVRTFQEYIEELKNINGEELINNVIEIINNNDDLIPYIALLWRDQIKKIEPTQIKK